jgi:hypothetical protein
MELKETDPRVVVDLAGKVLSDATATFIAKNASPQEGLAASFLYVLLIARLVGIPRVGVHLLLDAVAADFRIEAVPVPEDKSKGN